MNKPIDIILTTWKREEICKLVLDTLKKNTLTSYNLVVIDNGSLEAFSEHLNKEADTYVRLKENVGLEGAKSLGMSFVKSGAFISTDNDILVPKPEIVKEKYPEAKDWLDALITLFDKKQEYAAIALRPQVLVGTGDVFGDNPPEIKEFSHVGGTMRIMKRGVVEAAGAWKDKRPLRGHEEHWICNAVRKMGFKVGWASYIPCYHIFGGDNWGYGKMKPEEHGHTPVHLPKDDWGLVKEKFNDQEIKI